MRIIASTISRVVSSSQSSFCCDNSNSSNHETESLTSLIVSSSSIVVGAADVDPNDCSVEFKLYMMEWFRFNWMHPYPDPEDITFIASYFQVSNTVVENWISNNRSRRWYKSLKKAYELDRPVQYFYEDSLNIFNKKTVRVLQKTKECHCHGCRNNQYDNEVEVCKS